MFKNLDHIAIVVRNTENALTFYRDRLGLPVVLSESLESVGVRLTHLDLGNTHLQLVEPLRPDHPLSRHLDEHGESLHHLCMQVDDVLQARDESLPRMGLEPRQQTPHAGLLGRSALFIRPDQTRGVLWEITSDPASDQG